MIFHWHIICRVNFKYWSDQYVPISIYKSNQVSLLVDDKHSLSYYFSVISSGTGLKRAVYTNTIPEQQGNEIIPDQNFKTWY